MSRVLVVYASKHGSTQDVALAIAGGSLYMGRWHAYARRYLGRHRNALSSLPLAVFALGPLTLAEQAVVESRTQLDAALARFPDLEPELVCVFGGVIEPDALHVPFNRMPETDARDWSAIRAWANDAAIVFETTTAVAR